MSDEEDAEIVRGATADPENPPLTADNFRRMRPARLVAPEIVRRVRGQLGPQTAPTKRRVSLRLDADLVEKFRSTGPGWQGLINDLLRQAAPSGDGNQARPRKR
jgi:uncharacterized protein (DUF4415 family)